MVKLHPMYRPPTPPKQSSSLRNGNVRTEGQHPVAQRQFVQKSRSGKLLGQTPAQPIGSLKRGRTSKDDGIPAKNQKTNDEEMDAEISRLNQLEFENARLKGLVKEVEELREENQRLHERIEAYEKKEAESERQKEEIMNSDDEDEKEACRKLEKKRILQNKQMFGSYLIELNEINKWKAKCAELEEVIAVMTDAMETNGVAAQVEEHSDADHRNNKNQGPLGREDILVILYHAI